MKSTYPFDNRIAVFIEARQLGHEDDRRDSEGLKRKLLENGKGERNDGCSTYEGQDDRGKKDGIETLSQSFIVSNFLVLDFLNRHAGLESEEPPAVTPTPTPGTQSTVEIMRSQNPQAWHRSTRAQCSGLLLRRLAVVPRTGLCRRC